MVAVVSDDERPLRRDSSDQRIGRPRPTEEMPPQAERKEPSLMTALVAGLVVAVGVAVLWPGMCEGRSLRLGVQGEWSETIVLMTPSGSAWRSSSAHRASWLF